MSRIVKSPSLVAAASLLTLSGVGAGLTVWTKNMLLSQVQKTREMIGEPFGQIPPDASSVYRKRYHTNGDPVELLLLGDSIAAGLGARHRRDTLGARVAKLLGDELMLPVRLRVEAVSGSTAQQVWREQLPRLEPAYRPNYVLLVVGANDVIQRVPLDQSLKALQEIVQFFEPWNADLTVATCPDFSIVSVIPRALRTYASFASLRMGKAQEKLLKKEGVRSVALSRALRDEWKKEPNLFSEDRFHPSKQGYRLIARAVAPMLLGRKEEQRIA